MANLSENPQWVDGIYQIETSDPVVGGPDGVSNRQAKELASRTRYLKKEQEKTGSDLATHAAAADPHTQYAPKANPTFTGTPKAPTPAADSNSQQVATTAFVKSVAAALVNGAPAALDTLQELAKAMGNDPNFSATVLGAISDVKAEAASKLSAHTSAVDPHAQYAPKANPVLTGKPTAPTAVQSSNDTQIATTAFVKAAVAALVNGSPAALDTLQELANALGNDPNFSATVLGAISDVKAEAASKLSAHTSAVDPHAQYAPKANPVLTGKPTAPTAVQSSNDTQIATTAFVKAAVAALVNGSPAALDTLQELANALGNDPNFSTTVLNALAGKLVKDQNGADIEDKNLFVKNIGAARVFHGAINIGGDSGAWKTSDFLTWLKNQGAFNHPYWVCKGGWYYAGNKIITDTGVGNIQLAGAAIEVFGTEAATTIRVTTASTATAAGAIPNAQFTYINNGDNYSPGWRRDYNTRNLPTAADVGAIPFSGGTLTGELTSAKPDNYRISYGDYGVYMRNDGISFYTLITNKGDPGGQYNSLRPFRIYLDSGDVQMAQNVDVGGFLSEKGQRVYSPNNKPTPAEIGALPVAGTAVAATKLATPRKINGVVFDGSADITLTPANLGLREIIETGSGSGFYWRKYSDRVIEIFARVDVITGTNQTISFPVKTNGVIFILANDFGGYSGPNAYTVRPYNVTDSGFSVYWDRFNENGGGNKKILYYHVIANSL
ncbi:phage tail fiber protein [Pectobacterium actinidiae]|uniref:phage tail fiber protein n=1 Tax=Pectobacterium actinidiae TaxID=1507808 RepID=UPI00404085D6